MIPAFAEFGYLPPGVHRATLAEIGDRFGRESEIRRAQMDSIRWMVPVAIRAGVTRTILNGSFETDIMEPNDVDCVLLIESGFPTNADAEQELLAGFPFLEIKLVRAAEFDEYVNVTFGTDRGGRPKGLVEVLHDASE